MAFWSTKKTLISEHRKNYILRDINYVVKISFSPNIVHPLAQKPVRMKRRLDFG